MGGEHKEADLAVFSFCAVKIGRPGYRVTKQFDKATKQRSLLFQIEYPEIEDGVAPRHRFMSAFEQKVEAWDKKYQYLLFAAEPYEVISFKVGGVRFGGGCLPFISPLAIQGLLESGGLAQEVLVPAVCGRAL